MDKGVLYVVATPIGNLGDLSPRAAETLAEVDLIAAEDTRHSKPLLRHFGIVTPMIALHEHNERDLLGKVAAKLQEGERIALISDAGTPLISDPGFPLVRECHRRGIRVIPVPGPSAAVCALSAAGLPTDRFLFEGFLPARSGSRREKLQKLKREPRTLVFYETGRRILASLQEMATLFGPERPAVLARELTKLHETLLSGSLQELYDRVKDDPMQQKGEIVLLLAGVDEGADEEGDSEAERILAILMEELPIKQAVTLAARISREKKNLLYRKALTMKERNR